MIEAAEGDRGRGEGIHHRGAESTEVRKGFFGWVISRFVRGESVFPLRLELVVIRSVQDDKFFVMVSGVGPEG
jgi:hypothetical protein